MPYPTTRTGDEHDDFFGTDVADPYRWLEDGGDPEVERWLAEQGGHTRAYLDGLAHRAGISVALDRAVRLPSSGLPVHRGAHWFRTVNDGEQPQDVLVVSDEPFGASRVLVDPNLLSGDSTSLAAWQPSPDGGQVAYSYSEAGSDWLTWRVRDVVTGADAADVVRWSKFTEASWLPDGSGFVYGRFDEPARDEYVASNRAMRLEQHLLGTGQHDDTVVLSCPDEPDLTFWPEVTDDGRWLVVLGTRGTDPQARIWVRELSGADVQLRELIDTEYAAWTLVGSLGDELVLLTDLDAPRRRIVAMSARDGSLRELVAQRTDILQGAAIAGDTLLVHWLHDAAARLTRHRLDGAEVGDVDLPGLGTITEVSARTTDPQAFLRWTTFTEPPSVLRYADGRVDTVFTPDLPTELVTEQLMVTSADGTAVPVFLVHSPDIAAGTGPHPAWLYGYGGFDIAITPEFEPTRFAFAEAGGVVAVACLRGGSEYGTPWHDAGRLANKQNVFDDAIAVAQALSDLGWTTREHLALTGRSNGGLLAGAVLTQRPDLFAAVVPEVGVLDMLRFPLWTIGWAWTSDYGDPRADAHQFRTLYAYSPLHNVHAGVDYPPTMVMTSDHDDRVVPAHSMKFAATLQAAVAPDAVALLRVDAASGHKAGRSHDALVAERTDVLAFLARHTGLTF